MIKPWEGQITCALKLIYEMDPELCLNGVSIRSLRYQLGYLLGKQLKDTIAGQVDAVCPIPNTGIPYGEGFAQALHLPLYNLFRKKEAGGRSLHILDLQQRQQYLEENLLLQTASLSGCRIALIDEAIFTGITLKTVCQQLRMVGAERIIICIPTPPCRHRCVTTQNEPRFILLETLSVSDLPNYLGADSVFYGTESALSQQLLHFPDSCMRCFQKQ